MRITCCHCGERGHEEFTYLGDATLRHPDGGQTHGSDPGSHAQAADPVPTAWHDYVYLRDNPSGPHKELWQHTSGCRAWLVVTRDTRSHAIARVEPARDVALARGGAR